MEHRFEKDISGLRKNRGINFKVGLIIALGIAILAFNFTVPLPDNTVPPAKDIVETDAVVIPPTQHEKKKVPPPPTPPEPVDFEPIDDDIEFSDEPEPVKEDTPLTPTVSNKLTPTPTPPKREEKKVEKPVKVKPPSRPVDDDDDKIILIPAQMPYFKACPDAKTKDERKKCSEAALIGYISRNVRYPAVARESNIQGTAVVRFVVEKDGSLSNVKVLKDPGGGCGKEALRVVERMPKWETVGKQGGRPVRVQYTLPIRFRLD